MENLTSLALIKTHDRARSTKNALLTQVVFLELTMTCIPRLDMRRQQKMSLCFKTKFYITYLIPYVELGMVDQTRSRN